MSKRKRRVLVITIDPNEPATKKAIKRFGGGGTTAFSKGGKVGKKGHAPKGLTAKRNKGWE